MKNHEETCKKILDCLSFKLTGKPATLNCNEWSRFAFVKFGPYMLCHGHNGYLFSKTCCTPYQHVVDDIIKIASKSNLIHIYPWIDKDGYACYRRIVPQNVTFDELVVMSDLALCNKQ